MKKHGKNKKEEMIGEEMKRKILTLTVVLALIAVMVVPVAVSAATVAVNGENVTNNAIQLAINAAAPGDTISVGPGTYPEQLTITQSLTLKGSGTKTIIAPPIVSPDTTRYTNTVAPFTYGNASPLSPVILVGGSSFGTMSSAGCTAGGLAGYVVATEYTMPRAGTITSISVYAEVSGNEYVGIYSNIPGTPDMPGSLLVSSSNTAMIGGQWNTVSVTPTALTAGSYWITTNEDTDYMRGYVAANPNQTSYIAVGSYGPLPSTFGTPTDFQNNNYVAYATYVTGSPITVNIQNLKIDGTTAGNSATQYFWDIVYQDASGAISGTTDLAVAASLPSYTLFGSDYGGGIFVQSDCVGGISNVNIQNNMVSNYYKSGIVCDGSGTTSNITGNTVTGVGPVIYIAQNGIQISRGAMGTVNNNQISGNNYSAPTDTEDYFTADAQACGILLYNAESSVVVSK